MGEARLELSAERVFVGTTLVMLLELEIGFDARERVNVRYERDDVARVLLEAIAYVRLNLDALH